MIKLTLRRISLVALSKFGFAVGLVTSLLPLTFGLVFAWQVIIAVSDWLSGLTFNIPLPLGIPAIEVNMVELMHLEKVDTALRTLAALTWIEVVLIAIGFTLLSGILGALLALAAGLTFNLVALMTGGLRIEVDEKAVGLPAYAAAGAGPPLPGGGRPRLEISGPVSFAAPLVQPVTWIGSDPACQVRLEGLAPRQAQIQADQGRFLFHDLGQGPAAPWLALQEGVAFSLGPYRLVFRQAP